MKFNSRFVKIIRGLATVCIFIYGTYYVYSNLDSFQVLRKANWGFIVILFVSILLTNFASASENAVLFRALGAPVGNFESFGLSNVSSFLSLVLPQGGTLTKAVYLKQKYGVPFSKTLALFLGLLVITLLIGAGVMLVSNLITFLTGGIVPMLLWAVALIAAACGLLFLFDIPKGPLEKLGRIGILLSNFSDGWKSIRTNKSTLFKACFWQLLTYIFSGILVSSAYYSIGIKINPLLGISLSVLISITNIFVIVPGNIGIQEVVFGYFTYLSGLLFFQGVIISTLIRVVDLLATLLLIPFSWYFLFYRQNIQINGQ